jgi:hypothetical protein
MVDRRRSLFCHSTWLNHRNNERRVPQKRETLEQDISVRLCHSRRLCALGIMDVRERGAGLEEQ